MDNAAQIVVRRPPGGYRDLLRSYSIEVDGMRVGKLGRGADLRLEVPPGTHDVRATIDWTSSETVRIEAAVGHPVQLTVRPGGSAFQPWQIFKRGSYLKLSID